MEKLKNIALFERLLAQGENELVRQAENDGRVAIGYNCSMVPLPLLSLGKLYPVWMRAPEIQDTEIANFYMSPFNCSYSRAMLQAAIEGGFDYLGGTVFAESCVHIDRVLHNIEVSGFHSSLRDKFSYILPFPRKDAAAYMDSLVADMRTLGEKLSAEYGVDCSDAAVREAINKQNTFYALLKKIADLRLEEHPRITGTEWHTVSVACKIAPTDMLIEPLKALYAELLERKADKTDKLRIMIMGSDLDSTELTALVERLGCVVVADRYCLGSMPGLEPIPNTGDAYRDLAEYYMKNTQCPRMMARSQERMDYMLEKAHEYSVDGIVYEVMKFCDLWGWEVLKSEGAAKEAGIPLLKIEREYSFMGEGQMRTRVQAFVERINGGKTDTEVAEHE